MDLMTPISELCNITSRCDRMEGDEMAEKGTKITPAIAAKLLGVTERTFRRWLADGKIPSDGAFKTPGGRWHISRKWVDEQRRKLNSARLD